MPKSIIRLTALSVLVLLVAMIAATAQADEPPGAKLYSTYCAACHGGNGSGGMATAIGSTKFLNTNDDAMIAQLIGNGVPTKGMPAWGKSKGGALTDDQIASIVAYLRSLVGTSTASSALQTRQNTFLVQTRLVLAQADSRDGKTVINALLQEYNGYPIRNASLVFTRRTSWGIVEVTTAKTGTDGIATIILPDIPEAAHELSASFKGNQQLDASTDQIILEPRSFVSSSTTNPAINGVMLSLDEPLLAPEGSLITPNPPLLPATILVLVVGGVWAIYAYVISQLYGIWRQGRIAPRRKA